MGCDTGNVSTSGIVMGITFPRLRPREGIACFYFLESLVFMETSLSQLGEKFVP